MNRLVLLLAFLLAACGGGDAVRQGTGAEQAVSQQTGGNDAQKRAKVHTELGGMYLKDGRFAVALDEARVAVLADPTYAPAYNLRGLVYMYLRENRQAEDNFNEAMRLAPNDPETNNNYGWFLCQTDRAGQSMNFFQAAIRNPLYETPGKPLTNAGLCALQLKDDRMAEDFLLRALRADANNAQAYYWLADINYRRGKLVEARQLIAELHRVMGDPNAESLWLALRIERKLGQREDEARYASQLRRKFQNSTEYQRMMLGQFD